MNANPSTWLDGYASAAYRWQRQSSGHGTTYIRRLGIVEGLFDTDGTHYEGRADLSVDLHVEMRTTLNEVDFREHVAQAWSVMRQRHVLLSAKAVSKDGTDILFGGKSFRAFAFDHAGSADELRRRGKEHIDFVADYYEQVDGHDFYQHLMNSSRAIDPDKALARVFVLPFKHSTTRAFTVNFMFVLAHQITDGITVFRWASSFIDLLNKSRRELEELAINLCSQSASDRLPPPQEALYHPIKGNVARQRWFWAITRILRHKKHTNSAAFQNPLRRAGPSVPSKAFPPTYSRLLRYDRLPPLNNYAIKPVLSRRSTRRLMHLCRQSKISFGSGLFTLVAIVMMQFYEQVEPDTAPENRLPFIGSFPVNPRPFLAGPPTTGHETSLMLAFSDGITLPFLPSSLPLEPRFRLLGKQAHRQLRQYQKRARPPTETVLQLGTKSPALLLPQLYLSTLTRLSLIRDTPLDLQGAYAAASPPTLATCGVSSVGDRTSIIAPGKYDVENAPLKEGQEVVVADFRDIQSAVRARDGEFLCGAASDREKTYFMISVDGCAIDLERAEEFRRVLEGMLEYGGVEGDEDAQCQRGGQKGASKL